MPRGTLTARIRLIQPLVVGSPKAEGFRVKLRPGTSLTLPDKLAQDLVGAGYAVKERERAVLRPPETPEEER